MVAKWEAFWENSRLVEWTREWREQATVRNKLQRLDSTTIARAHNRRRRRRQSRFPNGQSWSGRFEKCGLELVCTEVTQVSLTCCADGEHNNNHSAGCSPRLPVPLTLSLGSPWCVVTADAAEWRRASESKKNRSRSFRLGLLVLNTDYGCEAEAQSKPDIGTYTETKIETGAQVGEGREVNAIGNHPGE